MFLPAFWTSLASAVVCTHQGHPLWDKAQLGRSSYFFRVNPYREMVSDMVRYTKIPFCGLKPFLRMVADVAKAAVDAGCASQGVAFEKNLDCFRYRSAFAPPTSRLFGASSAFPERGKDSRVCEFTFVEGGPHLGDCAMWATTVLRLVGVQTRSIAFEPLPDAAALFQQTPSNGTMTELIHFRGHNGQATVNGQDFPSQDRREVVTIPALELALDDQIPPSWPRIDALKLSVNGAERNTLAGARKLLSKRRICSVLMHATKCKRGRRPASEDPAPGNVSKPLGSEVLAELPADIADVPVINAALTACGRASQRLKGHVQIEQRKRSLQPSIITFGSVISALQYSDEWEPQWETKKPWQMGLDLFDEIRQVGLEPRQPRSRLSVSSNLVTFGALIRNLENNLHTVCTALSACEKGWEISANAVALGTAVAACEASGHWEIALQLLVTHEEILAA
eukprot:s2362_g9.t1